MRDVLAGFGLPFSRFAFSGATAGLLGAAAELMAVKVSGHSCGHLKGNPVLSAVFSPRLRSCLLKSDKKAPPQIHESKICRSWLQNLPAFLGSAQWLFIQSVLFKKDE